MWEKIKDWLASKNFIWFMLGWSIPEFLYFPSIITFFIIVFWVCVINTHD